MPTVWAFQLLNGNLFCRRLFKFVSLETLGSFYDYMKLDCGLISMVGSIV